MAESRQQSDDLEKADVIRERLDATYEEAQAALKAADGDVLAALAHVERQRREQTRDLVTIGTELLKEAQQVAGTKAVSRLLVRIGDAVVANVPLVVTGAAAVAIVAAAMILTRCAVDLEYAEAPQPSEAQKEECKEPESVT